MERVGQTITRNKTATDILSAQLYYEVFVFQSGSDSTYQCFSAETLSKWSAGAT